MDIILAVNAGSSSLKFQLFEMPSEKVLVSGLIERIGLEDSIFTMKKNGDKISKVSDIKDHYQAVNILLDSLTAEKVVEKISDITGVGHRVVHGGEYFSNSVLIDEIVKKSIYDVSNLAPLHNPVNLVGIEAFQELLPDACQVAVFDTAFHQTMKESTYLYPLPYEYYEKYQVRKYGFHGTSHFYVSRRVAELMDRDIKTLNLISIHLGNGASITAIEDGKSVNTSMGFTPLAGIMMGTRTGDVDPAILPFIMEAENLTSKSVLDIFNHKSGMYGVSGISSDARDIIEAYDSGNERAALTLDMYANRVSEVIGSYFIKLGHVDALVFTGGIGENAVLIRQMIFDKISEAMGLDVNKDLNLEVMGLEKRLDENDSKSEVWIVPTDEELVIARDTYNISKD
ncbi:MAG: acetate kinase [Erysipelothrix sp.]|nr:acetate kinase [Erysipelothrix sp.]